MLSEQACPHAAVLLGLDCWNMIVQLTGYTKARELSEYSDLRAILAIKLTR